MIDLVLDMVGGLLGGEFGQRRQRRQAGERLARLRQGHDFRVPCAMRRAAQTQWRHGDLVLTMDNARWTPPTMPSGTLLTGSLTIVDVRAVAASEAWSVNPRCRIAVGTLAGSEIDLAIPANDWATAAVALRELPP